MIANDKEYTPFQFWQNCFPESVCIPLYFYRKTTSLLKTLNLLTPESSFFFFFFFFCAVYQLVNNHNLSQNIQPNFNGSDIFGTMEFSTRHR